MTGKRYPYQVVQNSQGTSNRVVSQPVKKQKKAKKQAQWLVFAIFAAVILLSGKFVSGFFTINELNEQQAVLEERLQGVKAIEAELLEKVQYLETDEAVEKLAREKLGLVKHGEVIVVRAEEKKE